MSVSSFASGASGFVEVIAQLVVSFLFESAGGVIKRILEARERLRELIGELAILSPEVSALEGASTLKFAEMKALTAGDALGARLAPIPVGQGGYYATLAFNNDDDCPGPVTLEVIKVDCPLYTGQIKVIVIRETRAVDFIIAAR